MGIKVIEGLKATVARGLGTVVGIGSGLTVMLYLS
jgi:hypothetical protein